MFGLINKMFIRLLKSILRTSNHTKCMSLSNQKCMTQPTLINLHLNEYSQELCYYPFAVKIDRCVEICNTLNKVCIPNQNRRLKSKCVQHGYRNK